MGVFPEDFEIRVPKLMELWIAEGFLKPISGKCLEEVSKEYFNDLLGRNLVLVGKKGKSGKTKSCKIHDLLVDVCVREAQKHKFLCVVRRRYDIIKHGQRRVVAHDLPSDGTTLVHSLTFSKVNGYSLPNCGVLVRVWNNVTDQFACRMVEMAPSIVNCRYLSKIHHIGLCPRQIFSSLCSLWNLQRLHVNYGRYICTTSEIWKMSQLRHVNFETLRLLEPPPTNDGGDEFVLRNLHKLSRVTGFKLSEEVVKRIPNIKKLEISYTGSEDWSSCCLSNLIQLKLESLSFTSIYHCKFPCPWPDSIFCTLENCTSAKEIVKEQEELRNEGIHLIFLVKTPGGGFKAVIYNNKLEDQL